MSKFSSTDSGATILSKLNNTTVTIGTQTGADYICDGTSDDVQIQAAMTYAAALGGGTVIVRSGTYHLTASLTIPSNVWLVGEGWTTELIFEQELTTSAQSDVLITNSDWADGNTNIQIRNIKINGYTSNKTASKYYSHGIGFHFVTDFIIDNVYLYDNPADGIDLFMGSSASTDCCARGKIINCRINGAIRNGISVESGQDIIIDGNNIQDCDFDGIDIEGLQSGGANQVLKNIQVINNNVTDFAIRGINLYCPAVVSTYRNIVIANNNVSDSKDTDGDYRGLGTVYAVSGIAVTNNANVTLKGVQIIGNNIYNVNPTLGAVSNGIWIVSEDNSGIVCSDNCVDLVNQYGIYNQAYFAIIHDNNITNSPVGIRTTKAYSNIHHNTLYDCTTTFIHALSTSGFTISNNIIRKYTAGTSGIILENCDDSLVNSNDLIGTSSAKLTNGIYIIGDSNVTQLVGNKITQTTNGIIEEAVEATTPNNLHAVGNNVAATTPLTQTSVAYKLVGNIGIADATA